MKRLLALFALILPIAVFSQPAGIFGGMGTFAQLPGNIPLVFNVAPTSTSTAIKTKWPGSTGAYLVVFSDWESRSVTLTNNATTATWAGALVGSPTVTATIDGYTATPPNGTYGFTSDLGVVQSTSTGWFATSMSTGAPLNISSGCTTISASKGSAVGAEFASSGTTCAPVIQLPPAPNGWFCIMQDTTSGHGVVSTMTAHTTYSCTLTLTNTAADVMQFTAVPY